MAGGQFFIGFEEGRGVAAGGKVLRVENISKQQTTMPRTSPNTLMN
jgi:hypothetical protein